MTLQNLPAIVRWLLSTHTTKPLISERLRSLLFPGTFRTFSHRRWLLNGLRTAHIVCLCILVGGFFFDQNASLLKPWLIGTLISGLGMFSIDLYGSCIALFEARGMSVLIKLATLALLPLFERESQLYLLVGLIIFSSMVSHGSRRLRHWSFMSRAFQQWYGERR
ncbi:MAG: hypothetical protein GY820_15370 [Gammaproteobacteria bacterium]|nr:hypothetical protein [Gammaproteobacteria bacterium]